MSGGPPARRGGGRGRSSGNSNNNHRRPGGHSRRGAGRSGRGRGGEELNNNYNNGGMRDEEVLIAFMPFLKGSDGEAERIHEEYQRSNDQRAFLQSARSFLDRQQTKAFHQSPQLQQTTTLPTNASLDSTSLLLPPPSIDRLNGTPSHSSSTNIVENDSINSILLDAASRARPDPPGQSRHISSPARLIISQPTGISSPIQRPPPLPPQDSSLHDLDMKAVEDSLGALWKDQHVTEDPILALANNGSSSIWNTAGLETPTRAQFSDSPWGTPNTSAGKGEEPKDLPLLPTPPRKDSISEKPKKDPPKRLWTHFDEQPGFIRVQGISGEDLSYILHYGPREELTAEWRLPVQYLMEKMGNVNVQDGLRGLMIGLFRRGCTENGPQASIISKAVLGDDNRSFEVWRDPMSNSVCGKVPFYAPRTPGHVVLRMYWDGEPLYTLAMGPSIHVRVTEKEFESSVRFILSNFKGRKSNPTSLSSLHSLASVLETTLQRPNDSAARATWGCIQEARKVLEACAQEYAETSTKLAELEEAVEELKKVTDVEDNKSQGQDEDDSGEVDSEAAAELREKTRAFISGRASCERKWRDSQLAFASILKAIVTNPSMPILLRRDLITRMRIEFELWCPLSEEFAIPNETATMWYEPLKLLPQSITADDFRAYAQARVKMQLRTLGFDPNSFPLEDILFPRNRGATSQRSMDPGAVTVFNNLSAAMGQYFQELHHNEEHVIRQRELIRKRTEVCVQEVGAFPPGTTVEIFGSSANGFGSPKSDIDLCLQLPDGAKLDDSDTTGAQAMGRLAELLANAGMRDVDTVRLTARIPIIMYKCPNPMALNGEDDLIECDLSMHNPLAVLNTSLLRSYAEITPVTRVLASIIKRWAKARDINNPSRHTLSSYGYIVMLLHFLTYHKRTGNGLVSPVAPPEGRSELRNRSAQQDTPILPNLQWMDQMWLRMPQGTPYRDLESLPKQDIVHPLEENKTVNASYFKPNTPNEKRILQMLFPDQDLSLSILLASFFRYYAYEFDYKRYVVSLHSTAARGIVEREVKAELDGWRNYSAALMIEDPFETFYDIAHVLRGGYFHRIRREFAVAYSKIADAASGRPGSWNKGDLRTMSGKDLIDWICEPVDRELQPLTN